MPFKKPKIPRFIDVLRGIYNDIKSRMTVLEDVITDAQVIAIARYDFDSLLDWMEPLLDLRRNRIVLAHNDFHFDNLAVTMNKISHAGLEVMIFDLDGACYNMKGRDLGLFLLCRSGFMDPDEMPINQRIESTREFAPFLTAYLQEFGKHVHDLEREGRDSIDHLMMESLVGGMLTFLIYNFFQLKLMSVRAKDPVILTFTQLIPTFFDAVMGCRKEILTRFPNML